MLFPASALAKYGADNPRRFLLYQYRDTRFIRVSHELLEKPQKL
jgi:hypothetical protein